MSSSRAKGLNVTPLSVIWTLGHAQTSITARHCSVNAKREFSRILNWKKRLETWPARIPDLTPLLNLRGYVKQKGLNVEIRNTNYLRAESKFKIWQNPNYPIDRQMGLTKKKKISQLHFMFRSNHVSRNAWKPHYGTPCCSVVHQCKPIL